MNFISKKAKSSNGKVNIEREFLGSLQRFLLVNQIFCSTPVNLNFLENTVQRNVKRSQKRCCYTVLHCLWSIVIAVGVCLATYYQHQYFDIEEMSFLTGLLYIGEYSINMFNLCLVCIAAQYQKKDYALFFNRLIAVDINLRNCGVQYDYKGGRKFLTVAMLLIALFFGSVIIVDFLYNKRIWENFLRSSVVYTIPNIVSLLALTQYSAVVYFIWTRFSTINGILKRMVRQSNLRNDIVGKVNVISVLSMEVGYRDPGAEKTFNILRKQHAELSRLTELLNKSFGILILTTLIAAYVILSIQFYAFYKLSEGYAEADVFFIVYTVLWIILHAGKVLLILYPVNKITDEV